VKFRLGTIAYVFALLAAGMAAFGAWGIVRAVGALWFWRWTSGGRPRRRPALWGVGAAFILGVTQFLLPTAAPGAYNAVQRQLCIVNLKCLSAGIQHYESAKGTFPPAVLRDASGKPLHSWRTLVLPYMEMKGLYGKFDLQLPWDDPANAAAVHIPFEGHQCPLDHRHAPITDYFAVVGPQTAWPPSGTRSRKEITDGGANTILLMEAPNQGIDWAEPRDLSFEEAVDILTGETPLTSGHLIDVHGLFLPRRFISVAYVDGHMGVLPLPLSRELATALLTINGGEKIDEAELRQLAPAKLNVAWLWGLFAFLGLAIWPGVRMWRRA
jgi:hypothetical protein